MIYKTDWYNLIGTDASKIAISASNNRGANINCDAQYPYIYVSVKVVVVFGSIATNNCLISIYGVDRNASDTDSVPLWQQKVKEFANSERVVTIPNLNVASLDTIRVEIKNINTSTVHVWASYKASYIK
jgi:hypothetical protein